MHFKSTVGMTMQYKIKFQINSQENSNIFSTLDLLFATNFSDGMALGFSG